MINTSSVLSQDNLGRAVLACCSTIPEGVLLFCPSYGMIENLTKRWKVSKFTDMGQEAIVL